MKTLILEQINGQETIEYVIDLPFLPKGAQINLTSLKEVIGGCVIVNYETLSHQMGEVIAQYVKEHNIQQILTVR